MKTSVPVPLTIDEVEEKIFDGSGLLEVRGT